MKSKRTLTIGITGINAGDNPGPGIAVARSLREDPSLDVRILGLAYDAMEPGVYMDWIIDQSCIVPYPSNGGEAYVDRLLDIRQRHGLDFVIPNLDAELPVYIRYADTLRQHGIGTFLPSMKDFRLRGKDRLDEIADAIHITCPKTVIALSQPEVLKACEEIGLPCMIKGVYYEAKRANTLADAAAYFNRIVAEWGYPIIVQQIVDGEHMNVVALGDGEGGCLGAVGMKKVNMNHMGKVWTGVTVKNTAMLEAAATFVRKYAWKGPFELECIMSGDTVYLIEINPRFPAWTYFATGVGVNLPSKMLRLGMGQEVEPASAYEAGKLFIRYSMDMVTDMARFQSLVTTGEHK